jgi:tetratricopeptide (TPR) repeat protein
LKRFRRVSSWLAIAGLVVVCPQTGASAQTALPPPDGRLDEWLQTVEAHTPGDPGKPAVDLSTWSGPDLEAVIVYAKQHARALAKRDPEKANDLLLRGAGLHADIARLIPDEPTRRSERQQSVYMVKDGRWQGIRYLSLHWQLGRSLLDAVVPNPAAEPGVRAWYRETCIDLLKLRSLVEAVSHLVRALQLFPKDGVLLFCRGALHERHSSALMQAGSDSLTESNRGAPAFGTRQYELTRAERFYREALADQPDHLEARLRHGRVLGDLGRHEEAVSELRRVIDGGATGAFLYFAHLFLGRDHEALGDHDRARAELEQAVALYPNAQTPRLALSQIERRTGRRAAAQRQLQLLTKLPAAERQREDPWWSYYDLR